MCICTIACGISVVLLSCALVPYVIVQLLVNASCLKQNLRHKYGASWALVTGASSGIGLEITRSLAAMQLNVVLVALPDQMLDKQHENLQEQYPGVQFRKVAVDLSEPHGDYLESIAKATEDVDVQLVFSNAGYTMHNYFQCMKLADIRRNMECNVHAAMALTHLFVNRMAEARLRGCVVFTSSMSAHMVGPMVAVYAASKACLVSFAASLAIEVRQQGIDVLAICPGPVNTRYFAAVHKQPSLRIMKTLAMDPKTIPPLISASLGRTVILDIGMVSMLTKLMLRWLDFNIFTMLSSWLYKYTAESKAYSYSK